MLPLLQLTPTAPSTWHIPTDIHTYIRTYLYLVNVFFNHLPAVSSFGAIFFVFPKSIPMHFFRCRPIYRSFLLLLCFLFVTFVTIYIPTYLSTILNVVLLFFSLLLLLLFSIVGCNDYSVYIFTTNKILSRSLQKSSIVCGGLHRHSLFY